MEKYVGKWEAFEADNQEAMFDLHGKFIYDTFNGIIPVIWIAIISSS